MDSPRRGKGQDLLKNWEYVMREEGVRRKRIGEGDKRRTEGIRKVELRTEKGSRERYTLTDGTIMVLLRKLALKKFLGIHKIEAN